MPLWPDCSASNWPGKRLAALVSEFHVFAHLAKTQALRFNHLHNLQLEVCTKYSCRIPGCSRFVPFRVKNLSGCLF